MFGNGEDVNRSLEFRFLVDRAILALRSGRPDLTDVFVRAAERLLGVSHSAISTDVSLIASRKGAGSNIATDLVKRLTAAQAAAVTTVWLLRGARRPAIDTLASAFRHVPAYDDTLRLLWAGVLPVNNSSNCVPAQMEVAAPHRR